MKRMRAVETDSVKSARKAKDKLHRPVKERQKLVNELWMGRNKTICMASLRESRDSVRFLVNTHVQSHAQLRRGFGTSVPFITSLEVCTKLDLHLDSLLLMEDGDQK